MHDTLNYFAQDPIYRAYNHRLVTFSIWYAYTERFLLPLSHDEVVHLKKPLLGKMPGDDWQRRANLRALYATMWAHPGKKLLFMGAELGQTTEWNFETQLEWPLLARPEHAGLRDLLRDLNRLYRDERSLSELDDEPAGFRWIDANDAHQSVLSFVRYPRSALEARSTGRHVVFVGNFTPVVRRGYRIGVPRGCDYREVLNTDARCFGGSNVGNLGVVQVEAVPAHGFEQSIVVTLPPLAALYLVPVDDGEATPVEIEAERQARDDAARALAEEANATVEAMTRPSRGDDAPPTS
jgi:1,4-alpha-glucan branching enzyme